MPDMTKKVQVTLPDRLAGDLERWAVAEGRPLSNLCAYLLEQSVRDARKTGDYPQEALRSEESSEP